MEKKKITIDDIARDLGISKTTVSRAISGKGRIGKSTVDRVMAYIEQQHYHPSAIAKSLAKSRSYNIAFVMSAEYGETDLPFFQKCMWGVSDYISNYGYDVIYCLVSGDDISQLQRLIRDQKIDGAIFGRTTLEDEALAYLKSHDIPFVTVGTLDDDEVIQVDNDHTKGCHDLTAKLLEGGMKKPAILGGDMKYIVNKKRYEGFESALKDYKKKADKKLSFLNLKTPEDIEKAVEDALLGKTDCIVCMDDNICIHAINYLHRKNIKIPEDVKIASFYDSMFLENHQPPVSALLIDIKELGAKCGEAIIACINKETDELSSGKQAAMKTDLLLCKVMMKESTGNI